MAATVRCLGLHRRSWAVARQIASRNNQLSTDALTVSSEETKNSLYPPIKPKYPPGKWGGMEPSYAWLWHKQKEEILEIQDVQRRIAALGEKEYNQHVVKVKDIRPRTLELKKYMTKTEILPGLPDIYEKSVDPARLDELTSKLSPLVCDLIVLETDEQLRRGFLKKFQMSGDGHQRELSQGLLRSILLHLTAELSAEFPHLLTSQFDEDVAVSAFWGRDGITRSRRRMIHPENFEFVTVSDAAVKSTTTADFVMHAEKPLPEFVSRDAAPSIGEVPKLQYTTGVYGGLFETKGKRQIDAGHMWGDPCEFGSLAVLNSVWSRHVTTKYGTEYTQEALLGQSVMTSFLWLAAQAYHQGFSTLVDLTYPLTTQTVLTDGQTWQFTAYQLNTLELWKDQEANAHVNLCWQGPPPGDSSLFEAVEEGQVRGFNPEVLRRLIGFLALAPEDRGYDLRPTLSGEAPSPRDREVLIPMKEEVVEVVEEDEYVVE